MPPPPAWRGAVDARAPSCPLRCHPRCKLPCWRFRTSTSALVWSTACTAPLPGALGCAVTSCETAGLRSFVDLLAGWVAYRAQATVVQPVFMMAHKGTPMYTWSVTIPRCNSCACIAARAMHASPAHHLPCWHKGAHACLPDACRSPSASLAMSTEMTHQDAACMYAHALGDVRGTVCTALLSWPAWLWASVVHCSAGLPFLALEWATCRPQSFVTIAQDASCTFRVMQKLRLGVLHTRFMQHQVVSYIMCHLGT